MLYSLIKVISIEAAHIHLHTLHFMPVEKTHLNIASLKQRQAHKMDLLRAHKRAHQ